MALFSRLLRPGSLDQATRVYHECVIVIPATAQHVYRTGIPAASTSCSAAAVEARDALYLVCACSISAPYALVDVYVHFIK